MKQNNHSSWFMDDKLENIRLTEKQIKAYESLKKWMARKNRKPKEAEWFTDNHINNNINRIVE